MQSRKIETTLDALYKDSSNDYMRMMKGAAKSIFRPIRPSDFEDVYLSISKEQGKDLVNLIRKNNIKSVVEFGTSFGISTLSLALGILETGGHIITTELLESKAKRASENFKRAGVQELIELRVGDAMETLKGHDQPIDLLLLDGWKDMYLSLFRMLEPNFHNNTIIYVDNADMAESRKFLKVVNINPTYQLEYQNGGKVSLIRIAK